MRRIHLLLAGATFALLSPAAAYAQDAGASADQGGDEIVVTARKREERVWKFASVGSLSLAQP